MTCAIRPLLNATTQAMEAMLVEGLGKLQTLLVFSVWAAVVLVLVPGQASATVSPLVSLRWPLKPSCTGGETVSDMLPARSRADCARQCSSLAACNRFCFSTTSGRCYVRVAGASSLSTLATLEGDAAGLSSILCSARCLSHLGYEYVNGQCVKVHSQTVTYSEAKALCSQAGGHLYHFRSLSVDVPVIQDAMIAAGLTDIRLWLGAEMVQTRFQWSDGCPLYDNYTLWHKPLEPTRNAEENCVELFVDHWRLNDIPCGYDRRFVCQVDMLDSCAVCA